MFNTYFRTNTCGELRLADAGKKVVLSGWVLSHCIFQTWFSSTGIAGGKS